MDRPSKYLSDLLGNRAALAMSVDHAVHRAAIPTERPGYIGLRYISQDQLSMDFVRLHGGSVTQ